ncbi:glycoprotein-N-acetylgalactosamine 3-beta-galactosyltransferase 1-like isoform X2 [Pecten maximus]|uniref:glycoprotein-N-acetylgalactosamine 3-beta-galactosyltransferase 1-like isoform X2 n=1 Tax=Pecten maximus TaxID=6579 RepID=UPI001458DEC3|nr:glycoprotein-N-acetylgalactosamine 3-beta-galactosyltransferase 1-like isoform X2 [Pecten maximus]
MPLLVMSRNTRCSYVPQVVGVNFGFGVIVGLLIGFVLLCVSSLHYPTLANGFFVTIDNIQFVENERSSVFRDATTTFTTGKTKQPEEQDDKYIMYTKELNVNTRNHTLVNDSTFHKDNDKIAKDLWRKVRILCLIMTSENNLNTKAKYVKQTWAKRCNSAIFITSKTNTGFPTVGLDIPEGREHLTAKTMKAFQYIFKSHFNEADWFIKIDDDSFVILENLRYFLSSYSPDDAVYFGHSFKSIVKQGFYCGGGGHVLSKEALRRLAMNGLTYTSCQYGEEIDVELGKCMEYLGVETADSTDALGRSRFHCFDLEKQLAGVFPEWYYKYDANGAKQVMNFYITTLLRLVRAR